MPPTKVGEHRAPDGSLGTVYSLTWYNDVKTETLPPLPKLDLSPDDRLAYMDDLHFWPFAFMYLEYEYNGRHLQREAVDCIMGMVFNGEKYKARPETYGRLEDVTETAVIEVRRLAEQFRNEWKPCIDVWYREAYNRYPSFKARHDYLPGL